MSSMMFDRYMGHSNANPYDAKAKEFDRLTNRNAKSEEGALVTRGGGVRVVKFNKEDLSLDRTCADFCYSNTCKLVTQAFTRVNSLLMEMGEEAISTDVKDTLRKLEKGICRGSVDALLDQCAKGLSIEDSVKAVSSNKRWVYFRQLFIANATLLNCKEQGYKDKQEVSRRQINEQKKIIEM